MDRHDNAGDVRGPQIEKVNYHTNTKNAAYLYGGLPYGLCNILNYQPREHKAEYGCNVRYSTVNLSLF